jgi:phenylpropionate dioxygenase-like ring-hydroxylating dioxygenase large terminal subunit
MAWHPVALAAGLQPGTSTGTRVDGHELVVWRDNAGASHVWEDRCPHRGMRLSFGFVRGNHIACLYHGWQYDTAGQCRLIPAHPEINVPKTIRATRHLSVERLGIIWTHPDAGAAAPPDEAAVTPVRTLAIDVPAASVLAELGAALAHLDVAGLPVIAAVQSLSARESAVHLVITGLRDAPAQKTVSAWAVALRSRLEAGAP